MDGLLFLLVAFLTVLASIMLSYYADGLNNQTKISGLMIGGVILASLTSLPELVTALSAIYIGNPSLAIGDILGSNMFNIVIISFLNLYFFKKLFMNKILKSYSFTIILLIIVHFVLLIVFYNNGIFGSSFPTVLIFISYVIYLFLISKIKVTEKEIEYEGSKKNILLKFILAAILMVFLSISLTFSANHIAYNHQNFSSSIIGAFLLGITTSLPELVTTLTLIRIDSYNLAFSNIIGSNMFNLLILAICGFFTVGKSLYSFGGIDDILLARGGLYFSIIILYQVLRRKSISKITYFIFSIFIILFYLYIWGLQFLH